MGQGLQARDSSSVCSSRCHQIDAQIEHVCACDRVVVHTANMAVPTCKFAAMGRRPRDLRVCTGVCAVACCSQKRTSAMPTYVVWLCGQAWGERAVEALRQHTRGNIGNVCGPCTLTALHIIAICNICSEGVAAQCAITLDHSTTLQCCNDAVCFVCLVAASGCYSLLYRQRPLLLRLVEDAPAKGVSAACVRARVSRSSRHIYVHTLQAYNDCCKMGFLEDVHKMDLQTKIKLYNGAKKSTVTSIIEEKNCWLCEGTWKGIVPNENFPQQVYFKTSMYFTHKNKRKYLHTPCALILIGSENNTPPKPFSPRVVNVLRTRTLNTQDTEQTAKLKEYSSQIDILDKKALDFFRSVVQDDKTQITAMQSLFWDVHRI
eukprot:1701868-Rhodomonas_salina.1